MNKERLDQLLAAFYAGETSLDEEQELMLFFAEHSELADSYPEEVQLFQSLSWLEADVEIPAHFNAKLDTWLDEEIEKSSSTPKGNKLASWYRFALATAASLALLIGLNITLDGVQPQETPSLAHVQLTPEDTAELTKEVLLAFSDTFHKGIRGVQKADNQIQEVNRVLNKVIKQK
ncbi:hypothetical protein Bcop_1778 [Bacteroides coprosuis DSM 18011]|uniref:Uncharacterized protein n=1 Tax=Bacteroides coprosuis DSM 18011 TaxID=679937 RepID=F3ZRG0_9BACE|nr:hypothetical protein [Bacteroides coprosuis]EGJ71968.1 hypothetical protein Bcop_1778 [Bacteroides coprosuis DSM 18011]